MSLNDVLDPVFLSESVACALSAPLGSSVEAAFDCSAHPPESLQEWGPYDLVQPLPQSPESFQTSPFNFLTLSLERGPCVELGVLVGSLLLPSQPPSLSGLRLILPTGTEWRESLELAESLDHHLGFYYVEKKHH